MDLIEISEKYKMEREQAALLLHKLADSLARQNSLNFDRKGMKFHIDVPKEVMVEIELEIESDKSSIEIEISW
jgi:amphi-Trp domain-containing protein